MTITYLLAKNQAIEVRQDNTVIAAIKPATPIIVESLSAIDQLISSLIKARNQASPYTPSDPFHSTLPHL